MSAAQIGQLEDIQQRRIAHVRLQPVVGRVAALQGLHVQFTVLVELGVGLLKAGRQVFKLEVLDGLAVARILVGSAAVGAAGCADGAEVSLDGKGDIAIGDQLLYKGVLAVIAAGVARVGHVRILFGVPILIDPDVTLHLHQSIQYGYADGVGAQDTAVCFAVQYLIVVGRVGKRDVVKEVRVVVIRPRDLLHVGAERNDHRMVLLERDIAEHHDKGGDVLLRGDRGGVVNALGHICERLPVVARQIAFFSGMRHVGPQPVFSLSRGDLVGPDHPDGVIRRGRAGHRSAGDIAEDRVPVGAAVSAVANLRDHVADHQVVGIPVRAVGGRESPVDIAHVALLVILLAGIDDGAGRPAEAGIVETGILVAAHALLRVDVSALYDSDFGHAPDPGVVVGDIFGEVGSVMYAALVDRGRRIGGIHRGLGEIVAEDILAVVADAYREGIAMRVIHRPGHPVPRRQIRVVADHGRLAGHLVEQCALIDGGPEFDLHHITRLEGSTQLEDQRRFVITEVALGGWVDLGAFHVRPGYDGHILRGERQLRTGEHLNRVIRVFHELHARGQNVDHDRVIEGGSGLRRVVGDGDRILDIRRIVVGAGRRRGAQVIDLGDVHDGQLEPMHLHLGVRRCVLGLDDGRSAGGSPLAVGQSGRGSVDELGDLDRLSGLCDLVHLHQHLGGCYLEFFAQHITYADHGLAVLVLGIGRISGSAHDLVAVVADAEGLRTRAQRHGHGAFGIGGIIRRYIDRLVRFGIVVQIDRRLDLGVDRAVLLQGRGALAGLTDMDLRYGVGERSSRRLSRQAGVLQHEGTEHLVLTRDFGLQRVGDLAGTRNQGVHVGGRVASGAFDHDVALFELFGLFDDSLRQVDVCQSVDVLQRIGGRIFRIRILHGLDLPEPAYARVVLDHRVVHLSGFGGTQIGLNEDVGLAGIPVLLAVAGVPEGVGAQVTVVIGELVIAVGKAPVHALGQLGIGILQRRGGSGRQTLDIRPVRREVRGNLVDVEVHDRMHAVRVLADVDLCDRGLDQRVVVGVYLDGAHSALVLEHIGVFDLGRAYRDGLERQLLTIHVHALDAAVEVRVKAGFGKGVPLEGREQGLERNLAFRIRWPVLVGLHDCPGAGLGFALSHRAVVQGEPGTALADLFGIVRIHTRKLRDLQRVALRVGEELVLAFLRIERVVLHTVCPGEGGLYVVLARVRVEHVALGRLGFNDVIVGGALAYQRDEHAVFAGADLRHDGALQLGPFVQRIEPYLEFGAGQGFRPFGVVLEEGDRAVHVAVGDLDQHFVGGAGRDLLARVGSVRVGRYRGYSGVAELVGHPNQVIAVRVRGKRVAGIGGGRRVHGLLQPVALAYVEVSHLVVKLELYARIGVAAAGAGQGDRTDLGAAGLGVIDVQGHGPVEAREFIIGMIVVIDRLMSLQGGHLRVEGLYHHGLFFAAHGRDHKVRLHRGIRVDHSLIGRNSRLQVGVGEGKSAGDHRGVHHQLVVLVVQRRVAVGRLALQEHVHAGLLVGDREYARIAGREAAHIGPAAVGRIVQRLDLRVGLGRGGGRQRDAQVAAGNGERLVVYHEGSRLILEGLRVLAGIRDVVLGEAHAYQLGVRYRQLEGLVAQVADGGDHHVLVLLAHCIAQRREGVFVADEVALGAVHQVGAVGGTSVLVILGREQLLEVLDRHTAFEGGLGEVVGAGGDVVEGDLAVIAGGLVDAAGLALLDQAELQARYRSNAVQLGLLDGEIQLFRVGHVHVHGSAAHEEVPVKRGSSLAAGIGILV